MGAKRKKGTSVDDFLAAPERLMKDEAERRKALQRKAREEARQARLRASKRKNPPSVEDMLADIVRVAEDKDLNPIGARTRTVGRRLYAELGNYPAEFIDREFGTWAHAQEAAGLRDEIGTTLWRSNRAKQSRREHSERLFNRFVRPYVARQEDYRHLSKPYVLLSISDLHSQWLCPFVFASFLQAIRDIRPDGVLINGDYLEGSEISRHLKIPGWTVPLQDELAFTRSMLGLIRDAAPDEADVWLVDGNHDTTSRLSHYLAHVAPAIAGLDELRVDRLLGLGDLDVKLMLGGTPLSPPGTEDAKPGFLLYDYRIHHGTRLGQEPARAELRDAGRSGQSGHVHRASLAYGTTERDEGLSWMCTPMAARHEVGRSYVKGTNTGWQRGFGFACLYPGGAVHQYPCVVSAGSTERIHVEGHIYERAARCKDPEPKGNWLSDWTDNR